ncbi:MAG TPA: hypothetical protein VGE22_13425 [Solimonas sp.]
MISDSITPATFDHLVNEVLGHERLVTPVRQVIAVLQGLESIGSREVNLNKSIASKRRRYNKPKPTHTKRKFGNGSGI